MLLPFYDRKSKQHGCIEDAKRLFNISNGKARKDLSYVNILQFYTPPQTSSRIVIIIIILPLQPTLDCLFTAAIRSDIEWGANTTPAPFDIDAGDDWRVGKLKSGYLMKLSAPRDGSIWSIGFLYVACWMSIESEGWRGGVDMLRHIKVKLSYGFEVFNKRARLLFEL